eukprot:Clim_evm82s207 gene=Clim_evmTU82s207
MAGTIPVPKRNQFNEAGLKKFLESKGLISRGAPVTVRSFPAGQSNPTYFVQCGSQEMVLRRKPSGDLLKSAHQVDREFRCITALHKVGFPVPKPIAYCGDRSVIGTEFYLMSYIPGRIFRDGSLPDLSPNERSAIYKASAETLAMLHSYNLKDLGLEDLGKPGSYLKRQVTTWRRQYVQSSVDGVPPCPEMEKLYDWLQLNCDFTEKPAVLVHGDYRLDNMVFHPTEPRVIAVLDWELATSGEGLAELAYSTVPWMLPNGVNVGISMGSGQLPKGIPSQSEYWSIYARAGKVEIPEGRIMRSYLAYSLFRVAAISRGIHGRVLQGNNSNDAGDIGGATVMLARLGYGIATSNPQVDYQEYIVETPRLTKIKAKLLKFMDEYIYPSEPIVAEQLKNSPTRWTVIPKLEELKKIAKAQGLWNLFLTGVSGLGQYEYAQLAEIMGRAFFASEVFNCSAPDTGNMEVLHLYGTPAQKRKWLEPLLAGEIRSVFCMTEPQVASSDATNVETSIRRDGDYYVINGRKWWSSGAGDPRAKILVVMGKTDTGAAKHAQQSMILVPMDTPGVQKVRHLNVFGYDDAPHGHYEMKFTNVRVPKENLLLGEGRGFEIAQGRLGPGRIHHCMRTIGVAERALEVMMKRVHERVAFGKKLIEFGTIQSDIAESRMEIEQARLLCLKAAKMIDVGGTKLARKEIAMIKVIAPRMALNVIDRGIQAHGGGGVSQDFPLAYMYSMVRTLRLADGPDEVHKQTIAKEEARSYRKSVAKM